MNVQSPTKGLYINGTCKPLSYLTILFAKVRCFFLGCAKPKEGLQTLNAISGFV